jgi:hypothetical protein
LLARHRVVLLVIGAFLSYKASGTPRAKAGGVTRAGGGHFLSVALRAHLAPDLRFITRPIIPIPQANSI